jgi:hypothetical protein
VIEDIILLWFQIPRASLRPQWNRAKMSEQDAYNLQIKTHRHTKFIEKWVLAGGVFW